MARFLASDEAATCTQPIHPTEITRYRAAEMAVFSLDIRYCHVAIVLLALNRARCATRRSLRLERVDGARFSNVAHSASLGCWMRERSLARRVQPYGRSVSNFASMSATNAFEVSVIMPFGHAMREKNAFVAISDRAYVVF
jgi:hypothetical protein